MAMAMVAKYNPAYLVNHCLRKLRLWYFNSIESHPPVWCDLLVFNKLNERKLEIKPTSTVLHY